MMCELPTRVVVGVEGTWEVLVRGVEGTPDIVEVDEERVCVTCGRDLGEEIQRKSARASSKLGAQIRQRIHQTRFGSHKANQISNQVP